MRPILFNKLSLIQLTEKLISSSWPSDLKLQKIDESDDDDDEEDEYYDDDDEDEWDDDDDDDDDDWLDDDDDDEYDDDYYDDDDYLVSSPIIHLKCIMKYDVEYRVTASLGDPVTLRPGLG